MIIIFICTECEDELEDVLQCLNYFHPNLKFIHDKSKVSVNFLDVTVRINGGEFEIYLYCKSTDCHQFLEFNSVHPIHNKKLIVYSHGLLLKGCVPKKMHLNNILKISTLGLARVVVPKNLLAIKLGSFLKANQSSYLKVTQRLGLVKFWVGVWVFRKPLSRYVVARC